MSFFVTGTDTGVGKTFTVVQLLRLLRRAGRSCAGFKPICCGDRRDAELLLAAGSEGFTIDEVNPVWLKTPAAPLVAAQIEQVEIDIDRVVAAFHALRGRVEHLLVEGVGGWLVPIKEDYFVSDLAADLNLPVLLVVENRLGCLSHTGLSIRGIRQCGLRCEALVLNDPASIKEVAQATNADVLRRIVDVPVLPGLTEKMTELSSEWQRFFDSNR